MNLALSFCQAGKRVIVLDADMRRPRLHQIFPPDVAREGMGLAQVLMGRCHVDDVLVSPTQDTPESLQILPCGEVPGNPAELIETPACRRVVEELKERCDVLIIDSPPVLPVIDPLLLARLTDGVCLVTRCGATTRGEVQRALAQLRQADTNVLGVILNEVDTRQERYGYNYGYYYGVRDGSEPERA
jgi:capsular exopolysaccharide synthesis family protein